MARDLILGTAGHIDHGKTALVAALTGAEGDRLPEEKARGITIDLGFAELRLGDDRFGVVDVPGHERFIKNMLAGATGIDIALLVVAADDSVMPQTREHLDILTLLGVRNGVIALTKSDLVDETTREVAVLEIRELVRGTFLQDAPIIPTVAPTGVGIPELKAAIRQACDRVEPPAADEPFRLPIDRSFVVQGHGCVVTGSVVSGVVRIGDEIAWHRGDGTVETVRVRGLNNHGRSVEELRRGQRGAVNLAGVAHDAVCRGQELATPGYLAPSRVVTVRLKSLTAGRGLKHRLPVRVHVGTAEVMGTVSILDGDTIPPGGMGFAQLFLTEPVTAVWGQPLVIRDASAETTLGGGPVLQPTAGKLRRRHLEALTRVEALVVAEPVTRTDVVAWFAGPAGLSVPTLARDAGVLPSQTAGVLAELRATRRLIELALPAGRTGHLHCEIVAAIEAQILKILADAHAENPLATNHDRGKILARLDFVGDDGLLQSLVDRLLKAKKLAGDARRIARADFQPKLTANQRKLKDRIVAEHQAAGFQPPEPSSYTNHVAGNATALADVFAVACAEGHLVRISTEFYLAMEHEAEMRRRVLERLATGVGATTSELRELLGTTRKYAIPLCEYLDRCGVTKRIGDVRVLAVTSEASGVRQPPDATVLGRKLPRATSD